jgi:hypothetical protein
MALRIDLLEVTYAALRTPTVKWMPLVHHVWLFSKLVGIAFFATKAVIA